MPTNAAETTVVMPGLPRHPSALIHPRAKPGMTLLVDAAKGFLTHVLPPLVVISLFVLIWQMLGSQPGASLPPPSKVVQDTWELITQPFYDRGGNDVGIAWQLLASLKRVAYGLSLIHI